MKEGFWTNPWTISIVAGLVSSAIGWVIIWIWKRAKRGTRRLSGRGFLRLLQTLFVIVFILLFAWLVMFIIMGPAEASALTKSLSAKVAHAIRPITKQTGLFFRKHPVIASFAAGALAALALVWIFLSARRSKGGKRR